MCVAACGGLDPIVAGDGGPDGALDIDSSPSLDGASDAVAAGDGAPDGAPDASRDASDAASDAADADAGFPCGNAACDSNTHYCQRVGVDAGPPEAGAKPDGAAEVDTCVPYPASCTDDGGKPSCLCIAPTCACNQTGDAITVTCP